MESVILTVLFCLPEIVFIHNFMSTFFLFSFFSFFRMNFYRYLSVMLSMAFPFSLRQAFFRLAWKQGCLFLPVAISRDFYCLEWRSGFFNSRNGGLVITACLYVVKKITQTLRAWCEETVSSHGAEHKWRRPSNSMVSFVSISFVMWGDQICIWFTFSFVWIWCHLCCMFLIPDLKQLLAYVQQTKKKKEKKPNKQRL